MKVGNSKLFVFDDLNSATSLVSPSGCTWVQVLERQLSIFSDEHAYLTTPAMNNTALRDKMKGSSYRWGERVFLLSSPWARLFTYSGIYTSRARFSNPPLSALVIHLRNDLPGSHCLSAVSYRSKIPILEDGVR